MEEARVNIKVIIILCQMNSKIIKLIINKLQVPKNIIITILIYYTKHCLMHNAKVLKKSF